MNKNTAPSKDEAIKAKDLVAYLESGSKDKKEWLIGTEHEKFGYRLSDLRPIPYFGEAGIQALLTGLTRFKWEPYFEGDNVTALLKEGASVSLEPGGQLELSGAPLPNLHRTCDELHNHLEQVAQIAQELKIGFLGTGFQPKWKIDDIEWMPKGRYKIMREYMPKMGNLGLDMMTRTATVQVNLDFSDETDMVKKMRIGLALQPIITALFANSPFTNGHPNGFLSYRSHVWMDTDPDRCGMLDFVFNEDMSFEKYVDYALDVPMYFVQRDGVYIDASGQSFRDFINGELPALPGEKPLIKDWDDHLTTLFPEVRMKRYIEMRGADAGPWSRLCALPALWVGLLYDSVALDQAEQLIKEFSLDDIHYLRAEVPKTALLTRAGKRNAQDVALDLLEISSLGLRNRAVRGVNDPDERSYLTCLKEIASTGRSPAEEILEAWHGRWGGSVDPIFLEHSY
tara:strand:- start:9232 stop:10596 length:1365 start_codon:yes stop_codon:yes gene_type:complete